MGALKAVTGSCPSESLVYGHRTFPRCFLGRELTVWLARADKAVLGSVLAVSASLGRRESSASKAGKVLEGIHAFFQRCIDLKLLAGVNKEEQFFVSDCFYVESGEGVVDSREVDRRLLDAVETVKRKVEVKDRRNGFRSVRCFLASEAKTVLDKEVALFDAMLQENLIAPAAPGHAEFFQFVPRVVHSGFVNVSVGSNAAMTRRWVVLREKSLIVMTDNRKQVLHEVELTSATCEPDFSSSDEFRFVVTTVNERFAMMTFSLCERSMWLQLIVPLNTIVYEENELIQQAEAIIVSCSYFVNSE